MKPIIPDDVSEWIKARLNDITDEGTISQFQVLHAVDGESELLGIVRANDSVEVDEIAQEIWDTALADAETRMSGRKQRYSIAAYRGKSRTFESVKSFLIDGQGQLSSLGDSESSTPSGHLGQMMRHSEKLHSMVMQLTEVTAGRLARDLENERNHRLTLENKQQQYWEKFIELEDRSHEREMERRLQEQQAQRHEQLMGSLMGFLPLVLAKFLGGSPGGELPAAGARDQSLHELLKNLSEKEITAIFSSLDPPNQLILMELYQSHKKMAESSKPKKDSN
jgi:hypothetical protein